MASDSSISRTSASLRDRGAPAESTRRKRKTLACYTCQRRKVRCDRAQPACGRCRKAGQGNSCVYDSRANPPCLGSNIINANTSTASSRWPSSSLRAREINHVENRHLTLEADQNVGTWQMHRKVSHSSKANGERPALKADMEEYLESTQEPQLPETAVFRGENFRTQYYGSSNPTSLVAHVCYLGPFADAFFFFFFFSLQKLIVVVPRASNFHEMHYHATHVSTTCSTRPEDSIDKVESCQGDCVAPDGRGDCSSSP